MSLMLSTCIALLFAGLVSARCNCTSSGTSPDRKGSSTVLATFTDYTTLECEAACCEYANNLCGGYSRNTSLLVGKRRGECILFGKVNLTPLTTASGYTFMSITNGLTTFEVSNVRFQRSISNAALILSSPQTAIDPAACEVACRGNSLCQGYGMSLSAYVRSEAGPCTLYSSLASTDVEYNFSTVIVDVSGCARQPVTPEPLSCSSGDPSRDNYAAGQPVFGCDSQACVAGNDAATDDDLTTFFNPLAAEIPMAYVDLGQTKLVGFVTIFAPGITDAANLLGDAGFTLRVGDGSGCTTYSGHNQECPVCGTQKTLLDSKTYLFDCRGLRGRYVVVHAPGAFLKFAEIVVLPAPYFPETDEYITYSALGCCNGNSGPQDLAVPLVANNVFFPVSAGSLIPWVQVYLGPVAVPVGEVALSFPADESVAKSMFYGLSSTLTDDVYLGFNIGVSGSECQKDSPCSTTICGTVSRYSYAPAFGSAQSRYRVDCQGRTARYVFVQFVAGRAEMDGLLNQLLVTSLQVFPPSRIAPAIYPARSSLPNNNALTVVNSAFSAPETAYVWQQVELNERRAVGIVKVATTCMAHLLHQAYAIASLVDFEAPTPRSCDPGNPSTFPVENAFDAYYGSDHGAVVGVSDSLCTSGGDYRSSCVGTVCGVINQALTTGSTGELHVDCRGIVGKYVYIMLPQPQTAALNSQLADNQLPLLPNRDASTLTLTAYEMDQSRWSRSVFPMGGEIDSTQVGEFPCAQSCHQESLCKAWVAEDGECYRFYEYIPVRDNLGVFSIFRIGEQVCGFTQVNDPLQNAVDYLGASWLTFPPENFELPTFTPTLAPTSPTLSPSFAPSVAPSVAPTQVPSSAPSIAPTQVPSFAPSVAPTQVPSSAPSVAPSFAPSVAPTQVPSSAPSLAPTQGPSSAPSLAPTQVPSSAPSLAPSFAPSVAPTQVPSSAPSIAPTFAPTGFPTEAPTLQPTQAPNLTPVTSLPSRRPTRSPTVHPSRKPTHKPTFRPTLRPSLEPSTRPTRQPTFQPSRKPTHEPTFRPTPRPSFQPTTRPTRIPTDQPTKRPTRLPTLRPSRIPTNLPTTKPTKIPTSMPTRRPTRGPTDAPSRKPTNAPTVRPTSLAQQVLCAASVTCYDCMQAKCQWIQDDPFTIGCVPFCSEFGGKCRTVLSQCPESRDTRGYCSNGFCGTMRDGCSCQLGCEPNCCADFDFSCPGGLNAIGAP